MPPLKSLIFLLGFLSLQSIALAANSTLVMRNPDGSCASSAEICGDGIDQDCNGLDLLCDGPDKDRDGFDAAGDCDDTDRFIYPGIYVPCQAGGSSGTKLCQESGSYTTCSATPLCEATGTGRCYYISAATGSDTNPGTFQSPWKTFRNITSYYRASEKPVTAVTLKPGDVVYFISGLHRDVYQYDTGNSGLNFSSINGTAQAPIKIKNYPGTNVTLSPSTNTIGLYIFNSSYIEVEGIEIAEAYASGVRVAGSNNIKLRSMWIHDTDGVDNNNIAGVYLVASSHVDLRNSLIHDNYDRTCADTNGFKTSNSRNMVLFEGGNNRVLYNVIFQTPPRTATKTGQCVVQKHGQQLPGGIFEVAGNIFRNCWETSIGNGGYGGRIHHNLLVDSDPISILDHGGLTALSDNIVEFNTIINGVGLGFAPSQALDVGVAIGPMTYRKNIVIHDGPYNPDRGGILRIDSYGKDTAYAPTIANLTVQDNCYFSPTVETRFGLFSYNGFTGTSMGGLYNFSNWKALGYDLQSTVGNPQLSPTAFPGLAACRDKGFYAR